jgi:hypothetical protein
VFQPDAVSFSLGIVPESELFELMKERCVNIGKQNTGCPYQTQQFFNNFTTNEDIHNNQPHY